MEKIDKNKKKLNEIDNRLKIIKIAGSIIAIIVAVVLVIKLFPLMINLSTTEGQLKFRSEVSGIEAFFTLLALQFAQIILVVLPGEPLEILSGMYYGSINGMIFSLISAGVCTVIIYYFTKKIGRPLIYNFFKKKRVDKVLNSKLFNNKSRITNLMLVLFLIPGTPKDLLTYIGALLPIRFFTFLMIAIFGRIPSIISSTMAGATIANGKIHLTIIIYVITTIITLLFIWYSNRKDKKTAKEVIDTLKD